MPIDDETKPLDQLLTEFRADLTADDRERILRADDDLYDESGLPRSDPLEGRRTSYVASQSRR